MNSSVYVKFVVGYTIISIFAKVLKGCIKQPRPSDCYESEKLCKAAGMPSGTALRGGFIVGFAVGTFEKQMKQCQYMVIILLSLGLCCGRVVMKSHTISQVVAGYMLGLLLGFVISKL